MQMRHSRYCSMLDQLQIRIHGSPALPTLIYFPGVHGNWKLIGGLRRALNERVRFVEMSYPATLTWSLEEHAAAAETALAENGIRDGWLLAESFGSQVVWAFLSRNKFQVSGLILAGGFVRHPWRWAVALAQRFFSDLSFFVLTRLFCFYAWLTPFRFRRSPETYHEIQKFITGLTREDFQSFKHRLDLIIQNDPCRIAQQVTVPIYALTGLLDPVVPWFRVRPWLRKNCPALREYRIIWRADHNVLGTAPDAAAEQILKWMATEKEPRTKLQDPGNLQTPSSKFPFVA
jgi:pimeloyl-ACP methyl ester carboxylesterase